MTNRRTTNRPARWIAGRAAFAGTTAVLHLISESTVARLTANPPFTRRRGATKSGCLLLLILLLLPPSLPAQHPSSLTLTEAYELLERNHPTARRIEIEQQIAGFNERVARSGMLPELRLSAGASWQSDVTEVPFAPPGNAPNFSKDHYNLSLELEQPLFDGGRTRALRQSELFSGDAAQAAVRMEMHTLRSRLEQIWFAILMLQKQQAIQQLASRDVEERLDQVRSLVGNGVLLPGEERVLLAEQIRFQQELERMEGDLRIGYRALELLLGVEFPEDTSLQLQLPGPLAPPPDSGQPNVTASSGYAGRPEFDLFDARQAMLDARKEAFSAGMLPTLALFGRSFYGRPGFNVFNDDLQLNWIVGIRAQWSLSGTRNASLRRDATELQKRSIHAEREAFTRQLQTEWSRLEEEMQTLRRQISQDEEVVELRQEITGEKRKLLEQGVITSTEYLTELHAEQRARLNLEIRKIRLAQIQTEYQTQRGAYDSRL